MILKFGLVSQWRAGFAKVFFKEDEIVTDWFPIVKRTAAVDYESWPLAVNEHVVCVCDEYCETGVILGSIHSVDEPADSGAGAGKFRRVFSDGTTIEYDKTTGALSAEINGTVDVKASGDVSVSSLSTVTVTAALKLVLESPLVEVKGNVSVMGTISAAGISAAPVIGVPGDGKITAQADIVTTGKIVASDVVAGLISLSGHKHTGVQTGGGVSGLAL